MSKFNVGDKVRVKFTMGYDTDFGITKGLESRIVGITTGPYPYCLEASPDRVLSEKQLELVRSYFHTTYENQWIIHCSEPRDGRWIGVDTAVDYKASFQEYINKTNKKPIMTRISNMMKKLLDADTQTLVKAGYINGDLDLTEAGRLALTTIVFMEKKAEMVKMAEEKLAEEKE